MLGVFSPLFQTFTRAKAVRVERSTFCSLFLHDVVMRIQFSFLLKSEPISWCQFWNWDTLYFFCYSLYDHFIRCWAMLHTSGLVTVKKPFQKIDFSIQWFFFVFHHKIEGKASYFTLTLFNWVNLFLLHVVGSKLISYPSSLGRKAIFTLLLLIHNSIFTPIL